MTMNDIILHTVFNLLPLICLFGYLGTLRGMFYVPEIEESCSLAWHEEVVPSAAPKERGLDSLKFLFEDLEAVGLEALRWDGSSALLIGPSGEIISEEDIVEEVYVPLTPMMILNLDDEYVQHCAERDGFSSEDTVVEMATMNTVVEIPTVTEEEWTEVEHWLSKQATYVDVPEVGSDESVFFEETCWDDTLVDGFGREPYGAKTVVEV